MFIFLIFLCFAKLAQHFYTFTQYNKLITKILDCNPVIEANTDGQEYVYIYIYI